MRPREPELPLSPAPSPVPSVRRLRIHEHSSHADALDDDEFVILYKFGHLNQSAQLRVLTKLLDSASRETLVSVQSIISPRLRHDPFKVFPLEISLRILSYIRDPKSLAAAAQVSRLWYFLLSDDSTWKQMCRQHHYRRLSAAGSYVHQWKEFRDRAASQAIEETPEDETIDDSLRRNHARISARRHSLLNGAPFVSLEDPETNPETSIRTEATEPGAEPSIESRLTDSGAGSESGYFDPSVDTVMSSSPAPEATHTTGHSETVNSESSAVTSADGEYPLIRYGTRLPNFDPEMEAHLAESAEPDTDPIGEAYYDPQACVTHPPDSYRSHFRQQYLLNQAWSQHGVLAARYSLPEQTRRIATTVLMKDGYIIVALDSSLILVFSDDGKLLRSLYGHVMGVWALALHGHTLVSGGCDRDVREWDLKTGACRQILRGHSSTVRCLAIMSSRIALSGGRDGIIRVWNLAEGRSEHMLEGHTASVRLLEVTVVDGVPLAVSASYDGTARVWDVHAGRCLHVLDGHSSKIYSLAVDGDRAVTGSLDHTICVWDLRTGENLGVLTGHAALVGYLALRGNRLVSGGSDGSVRIWDLQMMQCTHRIAAHDHTVCSLELTEDHIITAGPDCKVQVWNARTGDHIRQLQKSTVTSIWGIAARDDRLLTVYSEESSIVVELVSFVPK